MLLVADFFQFNLTGCLINMARRLSASGLEKKELNVLLTWDTCLMRYCFLLKRQFNQLTQGEGVMTVTVAFKNKATLVEMSLTELSPLSKFILFTLFLDKVLGVECTPSSGEVSVNRMTVHYYYYYYYYYY